MIGPDDSHPLPLQNVTKLFNLGLSFTEVLDGERLAAVLVKESPVMLIRIGLQENPQIQLLYWAPTPRT